MEAPESSSQAEITESEAPKEAGQIRYYRVPSYIAQDEREALELYKAEDLVDLLGQAYESFQLTTFFMRNVTDHIAIDALPCSGSAKS